MREMETKDQSSHQPRGGRMYDPISFTANSATPEWGGHNVYEVRTLSTYPEGRGDIMCRYDGPEDRYARRDSRDGTLTWNSSMGNPSPSGWIEEVIWSSTPFTASMI